MSHTSTPRLGREFDVASFTIIDYTVGGEIVTPAEVGVTAIDAVLFTFCSPGQNSLGRVLVPILVGNRIQLFQVTAGLISEIPTTVALNANFSAFYSPSIL